MLFVFEIIFFIFLYSHSGDVVKKIIFKVVDWIGVYMSIEIPIVSNMSTLLWGRDTLNEIKRKQRKCFKFNFKNMRVFFSYIKLYCLANSQTSLYF